MLFALGFWEGCKVIGCYATFDLKIIPQLRKINCTLQNALAEKAAWWAAGWYAGLVAKSLLKVRLMCKASHASSSASAAPQNQANCIAQKFARWAAM